MATIGEVARRLGVSPDSIKRWEDEGKIAKPRRTCGGWRIYSDNEIKQLLRILEQQVGTKHSQG